MQHRRWALLFSLFILVGTVGLFQVVQKGFIPSEDTGRVSITTETAEGTSFTAMVQRQQALAAIIQKDPNVAAFMSSAGAGGPSASSNQGRFFMRLKPRGERKLSADQVIQELSAKLSKVAGIRAYAQNPPIISVGGRQSKSQYQFTLQGTDTQDLYDGSQRLYERLQKAPELADVSTDLQVKNPQVVVQIDRARAAAFGITAEQVQQTLYDAYGSRQVSTIFTPSDQYWVILELKPEFQSDVNALSRLYVSGSNGKPVPLSSLATVQPGYGPLSVNHQGQTPAVTLSFNLKPGVSLGAALGTVQKEARETLPATISTNFAGTAQAFQDSQKGLLVLLLIAVLVIYLVLGVLYESFVHPLTILSGLPFAGFGALLTLVLFRTELSIYAFVGIIMLVGLVKKNAIMMIDFALEAERNEGMTPHDAILKAASVRFRPIMMTTMAALMGTLPIAIGLGTGSEARRPLGLAVVGGLAFSQVITLYVTPVIYTYLDALQKRFRKSQPAGTAHGPGFVERGGERPQAAAS
jgi:HAE1 family hydrophobic/amphiphilic exporter-1